MDSAASILNQPVAVRQRKPVAVGQKFGFWQVIAEPHYRLKVGGNRKTHRQLVPVRCRCGKTKSVDASALRGGLSRSCGCLRDSLTRKLNTTHGGSSSALYTAWTSMRSRCLNPNYKFSHRYSGRGIGIAPEWESFSAFKAWSETNGYRPGLTLDRVDVDGNYEPSNCEWVTGGENSRRMHTSRAALISRLKAEVASLKEENRRLVASLKPSL